MENKKMEDRCPLCLKMKEFNVPEEEYLKYQNTERFVCKKCAEEIKGQMRPTWQVIAGRVFPRSLRNL